MKGVGRDEVTSMDTCHGRLVPGTALWRRVDEHIAFVGHGTDGAVQLVGN
ncbi:unannotated protein [freshwater metagenome]|uniref:Unannotated protein n=1 Tax=freshwater metagenome TaxID=449393 RepID=A0A6J7DZB4_9ZZZZ